MAFKEEKIPVAPITIAFADGVDAPADEYIIASRAREMIGCTKVVLARLIREGTLPTKSDKLDKRLKWVKLADVERLVNESPASSALAGERDSRRNGHALRASRG